MPLSIDKILQSAPQVKKDGNAFVIPEGGRRHRVHRPRSGGSANPARIMRVELSTEIVFVTHKAERFYFATEQVVGFRFGGPEARGKHAGAGFFKA